MSCGILPLRDIELQAHFVLVKLAGRQRFARQKYNSWYISFIYSKNLSL